MKCLACADDRFKLNKYGFCERCATEANRMNPDKKYGSTPINTRVVYPITTCPECNQRTKVYDIDVDARLVECDKCGNKWNI